MAIVKDSIVEDLVLNKSERAVIRGIYRASQLAEALNALRKMRSLLPVPTMTSPEGQSNEPVEKNLLLLDAYLSEAMLSALVSTKVPASVKILKVTNPQS